MKKLHAWICICIFLSGFSALIYEIVWLRVLGLTLGSTAYATSLALAVFLFGLAVGAYVGGGLADKFARNPLRMYGVVELLIGVSAIILTPILLSLPKSLLSGGAAGTDLASSVILLGIVSCIILVPPTMLMGATLPVVLKQVAKYTTAQKTFGAIYGLNTLGAVFGSLAAAFIGFSYFGLSGTVTLAASINILIGLGNIAIASKLAASDAVPVADTTASTEGSVEATAPEQFPIAVVSLLAFASGFLSLSMEVVWVKLLRFFNGSLTYSFTVMIATFLLGLALGSIIYEKVILGKDKTVDDQILRFVRLQHFAAIACAGSLIGIPVAFVLQRFGLVPDGTLFGSPVMALIKLAITSAACILLPATLIGILFPVLGALSSMAHKRMASRVGLVYAANTIGCVTGSVLTGLVLVPAMGSYSSFQLCLLFAIVCSSIAVMTLQSLSKNKRILLAVIPTVLATVFFFFVKVPFSRFIVFPPPQKLLFYGEDTTGTMFIVEYPQIDAKQLTVNGSCLATTALPSRRYMRLLGHLPMLLNPDPKKVMIACFGTGTTCGAVSVHPELDSLEIVELSPLIIKNGPLFADSNHNVLNNPKAHVHVGDARHFLLQGTEKFDVISLEPPPPADAGMVNLYTTEFYQLVSKRLSDNGIFGQWVPTHEQPENIWKMMIKSAQNVFPYVSVWLPNSGEALLMVSKSPIVFDAETISKRINASSEVKSSLSEVGIDSAEDLLASYVFGEQDLRNYLGDCPDVTDDKPSLEFFLPYLGEFVSDQKLVKLRTEKIPHLVKGNVNPESCARSREALVLSLNWTGDRATLYEKLEQLSPGNKWFQFLKKLDPK